MSRLIDWLDHRTGVRGLTRAALYEHIPGGARWRYVWGSTLMFTFLVQMVTGFFLWAAYAPSSQTAWESVYYIQHEMSFGWLLRGIHHYTAQTMIILLALHMLQVIVDGAYRAPREVNFWIGLVLLMLVLALSLTGYLLPWDQKGYWSTKVATNLMSVVPYVGPQLQQLVVGGADYGHHTLTRFFALHAGLLPMLMMAFIAVHVYVFRRHGLHTKEPHRAADSHFWPDQVLKDAVACLGVLLFVLLLVFRFKIVPGGSDHLGAELSAPADPTVPFGAARPEWYFLFLFQFLKYFPGEHEIYGAVVIPAGIMGLLFLMPLIGRWRVGHWFNVTLTMFLAAGMVLLTGMALIEDQGGPKLIAPVLGNLGPTFGIVLLSLLLAGVLVLIPLFARERSFRFNVIVLGSLLLLVGVAVLVTMAGGGTAQMEAGPFVDIAGTPTPVMRVLMFALLAALVILFTVALFRDYPHAGEVNLLPGRGVERDTDFETPAGAVPAAPAVADNGDAATAVAQAEPAVHVEQITGPGPVSLARWEWHHRTRLGLLMAVIVGAVFLAATSIVGTSGKPEFAKSVADAKGDAERVVELASSPTGIPAEGAAWLLRRDPKTQGPRLFVQHCASCHGWNAGEEGGITPAEISAPDLGGFASREWIAGLMDPAQVDTEKYYGPRMKAHTGDMVEYVKEDVAEFDSEEKAQLGKVIKALSAEAKLPSQAGADASEEAEIIEGRTLIGDDGLACTDCHTFHGERGKGGPDLTGYGSREWVMGIIANPAHPRFYGKDNDRMPAFGDDKLLTAEQIGLITDWLRGEWYEASRAGAAGSAMPQAAGPATTQSSEVPDDDAQPVRPAETQPVPTQPATTTPADAQPVATRPAETPPAPTPAAETKPVDAKPAEAKPAEEPPADAKPAADEPADEKPADEKPADEKPADEEPVEAKPAEPTVGEKLEAPASE